MSLRTLVSLKCSSLKQISFRHKTDLSIQWTQARLCILFFQHSLHDCEIIFQDMADFPSKWTTTWIRDIPDVQWQWNNGKCITKLHTWTYTGRTSLALKKSRRFWLVEFYNARVVLCSVGGSYSVQIRQKYKHPSVVLGWGAVSFICFKYRKYQTIW